MWKHKVLIFTMHVQKDFFLCWKVCNKRGYILKVPLQQYGDCQWNWAFVTKVEDSNHIQLSDQRSVCSKYASHLVKYHTWICVEIEKGMLVGVKYCRECEGGVFYVNNQCLRWERGRELCWSFIFYADFYFNHLNVYQMFNLLIMSNSNIGYFSIFESCLFSRWWLKSLGVGRCGKCPRWRLLRQHTEKNIRKIQIWKKGSAI